jgi:hypothetical protein
MHSSRVPVPDSSLRLENMGKKTTSQASEPTHPTTRRRRRKVTNLNVELAADLELSPIIERWERDLVLPRLATWLDETATRAPIQKDSSHGQ